MEIITASPNKKAIEQLRNFEDHIKNRAVDTSVGYRNFSYIDVNEKGDLFLDGLILKGKARKKLLSCISVKDSFPNFASASMSRDERVAVLNKLFNNLPRHNFYTVVSESNEIMDLEYDKTGRGVNSAPLDFSETFNVIEEALLTTDKIVNLTNPSFDNQGILSLSFTDVDSSFRALKEDANDTWRVGVTINRNNLSFDINQYFERLICTNGMMRRTDSSRQGSINAKGYSPKKMAEQIARQLEWGTDDTEAIRKHVDRLKAYNASVAEYLTFRNMVMSQGGGDENATISELVNKVFPVQYLNRSYGCPVEGRSKHWQSTADTGVNAYDLFNNVTHLGTHLDEYNGMDLRSGLELRKAASDFLFSKPDLSDMAEKVVIRGLSSN